MLPTISRKLGQLWHQAKCTLFCPPPFPSLRSIMRHQAATFTRHILRLSLTQADFEQRRLSLGLGTQPLGYAWTVSKWVAILTGYLAYFSFLPATSTLLSRSLGLAHFETVAFATSLSLTLGEALWWSQLAPLLGSQPHNDALGLLYAYGRPELPLNLTKNQEARLVAGFNRQYTGLSRYLALTVTGHLLYLHLFTWSLLFASTKPTLFQRLTTALLGLNLALQGTAIFLSGVFFSSQGLLFLRLFKYKLAHAQARLSVDHLAAFNDATLRLHGEMRQYNAFLSAFFFTTDSWLKLAGSATLVFFASSGLLLSNIIAILISLSILVSYVVLNGCFSAFAVFPRANLTAYRRLSLRADAPGSGISKR